MNLAEILVSMVMDDGLSMALVVGRDGLLLEGQSQGRDVDLETISALATKSVVDLDRLERTLGSGPVSRVRLRFQSYELLLEVLTETDILVAGVPSAMQSERLLDAVARYRDQLKVLLGDF